MTDTERIQELEMALMLFVALLTGEPQDATDDEKTLMRMVLQATMEKMTGRIAQTALNNADTSGWRMWEAYK